MVCRARGLRYWILGVLFAIAGWKVGHALDAIPAWVELKYASYHQLRQLRGGPSRLPTTILVAIGDAEYYGPELAARKPLRRDYLARLVTAIADAGPRLIALDVDFRSPIPDGTSPDFGDYVDENRQLIDALCKAQAKTQIVISKAVSEVEGELVADRNIYDGIAPCQIPGDGINVGYLALADDLRQIPLSERLQDGSTVDSLALAVARSLAPRQYPSALELEHLPYARFNVPDAFTKLQASAVLAGAERTRLRGGIILVYGDWHVLAKDRGVSVVDTFRTPVGLAGGAFVHANLIDTLMHSDYSRQVPERVIQGLEACVAIGLAIAFAFPIGLLRKLSYLTVTAAGLLVVTWLGLQVFAVFFDILPVLFAIYLHAVAEQIEEWRHEAHNAPQAQRKPPAAASPVEKG